MFRLEPNILKDLTIIPSWTSQKFYPLFLFYSQSTTNYSFYFIVSVITSQCRSDYNYIIYIANYWLTALIDYLTVLLEYLDILQTR